MSEQDVKAVAVLEEFHGRLAGILADVRKTIDELKAVGDPFAELHRTPLRPDFVTAWTTRPTETA